MQPVALSRRLCPLIGAVACLLWADTAAAQSQMCFIRAEGRHLVSECTGAWIRLAGVNLNGLEFGTFFDRPYPGVLGTNYFLPTAQNLDAVKASGFNVVRIPFEWARLVTGWTAGDPLPVALNTTYLNLLANLVEAARQREIYAILDMHDFLKYWSGQGQQVCVSGSAPHRQMLSRTWRLLAGHFRHQPAVLGYDLMNEPVRQEPGEPCGSCDWPAIAQAVIDSIREVDPQHLIIVEGVNYSLASHWPVENGRTPFVTDRVSPPRIVYSPHVFFDLNNDSQYNQPGEASGPAAGWEHYVRDRLQPAVQWSIDNNVPILIGETGVPCSPAWAGLLDYAYQTVFAPLNLSVVVWEYIDPQHCPLSDPGCALNLTACGGRHQLTVLEKYPGGTYGSAGPVSWIPADSTLYADSRTNPWDAGTGFWGDVQANFCASSPVFEGLCSLQVSLGQSYGGLKFAHFFGLDTRRFDKLTFRYYPTGGGAQNFKLFTTAPRPGCSAATSDPEFPATYEARKTMTDYLPTPLANQWQLVEIPLAAIVDPMQPIINGIAFQNMGGPQPVFYLDRVRLAEPSLPTHSLTSTVVPAGTGSISAVPSSSAYPAGTPIQVIATPASGCRFVSWSGSLSGTTNPQTLVMTSDRTVIAQFECPYLLTLVAAPAGAGTIAASPFSPDGRYGPGTPVQLTATASPGCVFQSWSGGLSGSTNPQAITMHSDQTVTASFVCAGGPPAPSPLRFVAVTPCRVADTRAGEGKTGAFGPPRLVQGATRTFPIPLGACGIPAAARAYSLNITVAPPARLSYLTVWPAGQPQPYVSTLNSFEGHVVANAAIVPAGTNGSINVFVTDPTEVILDLNGYFQ